LLVTGRQLDDLRRAFGELELFDWIVVENGAVLHRPTTGETRVLTAGPPPAFVAELKRRGVTPLAVGESIVATWHPNESVVLAVIRDFGLELQVIFNKGAVMVLPAGSNKATGVLEALKELGLSPHNLVAIRDAENDHALLDVAECSAAVANAVPMLKHRRRARRGSQLLLPWPARAAPPARPELGAALTDWGWSRRRDVGVPPALRGLLALGARKHQG